MQPRFTQRQLGLDGLIPNPTQVTSDYIDCKMDSFTRPSNITKTAEETQKLAAGQNRMPFQQNHRRPQRNSSSRIPSRIRIIESEGPPQIPVGDSSASELSDGKEQDREASSASAATAVSYTISSEGTKRVEIQSKLLVDALRRVTKDSPTRRGPQTSSPRPSHFPLCTTIWRESGKRLPSPMIRMLQLIWRPWNMSQLKWHRCETRHARRTWSRGLSATICCGNSSRLESLFSMRMRSAAYGSSSSLI